MILHYIIFQYSGTKIHINISTDELLKELTVLHLYIKCVTYS